LKKLIAISLLAIHLFTIGGQLIFYQYQVYKSDKFYNEQISKNHYNINDLTEISIPVNMPDVTDWKYYQNLSGRVQFQNSSYNYVKIRMTRKAIYLMCVPNYQTTHLSDQNIIYAGQIKDIPVPKKDHVPFGKINKTVYNNQTTYYGFSTPAITVRKPININHSIILSCFITGPGQPPDRKTILS